MSDVKIVKLTAENFKRLRAVEITPNGDVIEITGKNGAGKSSVLDSIMAALGGEKVMPDKPLRVGAEKGRISLDLGSLQVERTFTAKSTSLTVTAKDGSKVSSPQAVLNELVGKIAFDPLAFMQMDSKKQREELMKMVDLGFDPAAMAAQEAKLYEQRRDAGRDADRLRKTLETTAKPTASTFIDPEPIKAKIAAIQQDDKVYRDGVSNRQAAENHLAFFESQVQQAAEKIEEARQTLAGMEKHYRQMTEEYEAKKQECNSLKVPAAPDPSAMQVVQEELEAALANNAQLGAVETYNNLVAEAKAADAAHQKLERELEDLREKKAAAIKAVKMPIEGLGFDDDGLTYNGIPISQASASEQLRISVAVAMALNPKLPVILIRDASLLDSGSKALVCQMAQEKGHQVWLESVDETGKVGVVIEDGMVANA